MRLLFIENRYRTAHWEVIANALQTDGHEIHWLVQNPLFTPSLGVIHVLPYPKRKKQKGVYTPEIEKIIKADRGLNYFGIRSDGFIFSYDVEIQKCIDNILPDMVFGESTLFHELLTIRACKARNILYLHPTSCRYPNQRFSFYEYDSLAPYEGSGESLSFEDAQAICTAIATRSTMPDYMNIGNTKVSRLAKMKDKIRLTIGYYRGERYNTPSPFVKYKINKRHRSIVAKWEEVACESDSLKQGFYVLYPLQMQPEANIDVWGYPHRDQTVLIADIIKTLKEEETLVLKPNPKSKYEITTELLEVVQQNMHKVIVLKHSSKMEEIWSRINLVITVTGTISIECIFDNKPIVMFGQGLQTEQRNCLRLESTSQLRLAIDKVKQGTFPVISEIEKVTYLQELMAKSFRGINGDGLHNKVFLDDASNMGNIINAFKSIIHKHASDIQ